TTCLIRRAALLACSGFDEDLRCFEDLDLFLRLARVYEFIKLERSLAIYVASHGVSSHEKRSRDARRRLLCRYRPSIALQQPRGLCREIWNLASGRALGA